MLQSRLFTKTRHEAPKDEVAKNAELLIRAGYVHKEMAGVYSYLPLGLRALNKVIAIIREEMNAIGGQEILMTALQDKTVWEKSGRWSDKVMDNWFKTKLVNGTELGLASTHEEALTALLRQHIFSYKDLPVYIYQFQTKFRNELRAKSGIMRGREFLMKDLYSFNRDEKEFREFYELCASAYLKIFERVGLGNRTYRTFASGGSFSKFSDEFQTVTPAGEDIIYISKERNVAVNKEVCTDEVLADLEIDRASLEEAKAVEVGNIFPLGTRFSKALDLTYRNETGEDVPVWMGSYGIGPGRLLGAIVEAFADEKGIVWPKSVAPFSAHILALPGVGVLDAARVLLRELEEIGIETLLDDRDMAAGEKFFEADLIGIPHRLVISQKTIAADMIEYKARDKKETAILSKPAILAQIAKR